VNNLVHDTQKPLWQFTGSDRDESVAPLSPAADALWSGHGCLASYVEEEHVLWSADAIAVLLDWAEVS
jgi:hypothetical protein